MHLVNYLSTFKYQSFKINSIAVPLIMALIPSHQNWPVRYKLYHIPFWMLYNYLFWALQVNSPVAAASTIFFSVFFVKYGFYVVFPALAVYFNLYFLIPRYLEKGNYVKYVIYLLGTIIVSAVLIVPGYYLTAYLSGGTLETIYNVQGPHKFYQLLKGD